MRGKRGPDQLAGYRSGAPTGVDAARLSAPKPDLHHFNARRGIRIGFTIVGTGLTLGLVGCGLAHTAADVRIAQQMPSKDAVPTTMPENINDPAFPQFLTGLENSQQVLAAKATVENHNPANGNTPDYETALSIVNNVNALHHLVFGYDDPAKDNTPQYEFVNGVPFVAWSVDGQRQIEAVPLLDLYDSQNPGATKDLPGGIQNVHAEVITENGHQVFAWVGYQVSGAEGRNVTQQIIARYTPGVPVEFIETYHQTDETNPLPQSSDAPYTIKGFANIVAIDQGYYASLNPQQQQELTLAIQNSRGKPTIDSSSAPVVIPAGYSPDQIKIVEVSRESSDGNPNPTVSDTIYPKGDTKYEYPLPGTTTTVDPLRVGEWGNSEQPQDFMGPVPVPVVEHNPDGSVMMGPDGFPVYQKNPDGTTKYDYERNPDGTVKLVPYPGDLVIPGLEASDGSQITIEVPQALDYAAVIAIHS